MTQIISLNFFAGALSALFSLPLIYPFEYARQKLTNDISGKGTLIKYIIRAYQSEGLKGVYKGGFSFLISGAVFRAFYFGIFDTLKSIDE